MKNTAIKLSGILLAGAVFFSTLLGYGTQVAAATAIGSDTEAGQASGDGSVASVADLPGKHIGVQLGTTGDILSLIHISEPTRQAEISYAVFCLKKKKKQKYHMPSST